MGQNFPNTIPELLSWGESHWPLWNTNAAQIGLTAAQAMAFKTLVQSSRSAFDAAEAARLASRNATQLQTNALTAMRANAGTLVAIIKAYAEATNNPNIYNLSGISPPDPRGSVAPPSTPENVRASLNPNGSLTLKWKATQPTGATGVQYQIFRQLDGEQGFTLVDTVGRKNWTDTSLPRGVDGVNYILQAKRGELTSEESDQLAVVFGSQGGGGFTIASATTTPGAHVSGENKLAA